MLTTMIYVKNLEQIARFYRRGLDLADDAASSEPGYVVLTDEGTRLALHVVPDHVAARITIGDPPEPRSENPDQAPLRNRRPPERPRGLEDLGAQVFETSTDDAHDAIDPEGNVFRISTR